MPINYNDYPPNWKTEIRPRILERDGHRCKFCGVANYAICAKFRDLGGDTMIVSEPPHQSIDGMPKSEHGKAKFWADLLNGDESIHHFVIVLTIAHLHDPNPMNCNDDNLAALCQKCHNKHDAPMRRVNAKATIEAKKQAATGQINLF